MKNPAKNPAVATTPAVSDAPTFIIEKNVPKPKRTRKGKPSPFPFATMEKDDSFTVVKNSEHGAKIVAAVNYYNARNRTKGEDNKNVNPLSYISEGDNYRVYRDN